MSLKEEFSQENWAQIVQAPFVAGFAVTAADPGGLIGAFQESSAMAKALRDANGTLAQEISEELKSSEGRALIKSGIKELIKGRSPSEASEAAVARLGETMTLIANDAPMHYPHFADLVRAVARSVAEAANEGGFLGFGGVPVSDAEKKTLADIDAVVAAAHS